jgi:5-methyltetrahydrofolate--homocysteine methyltransferase
VHDASRAVNVVSSLLDAAQRPAFDQKNRDDQQRLREIHGKKADQALVAYPTALARKPPLDFGAEQLAKPEFVGRRLLEDYPISQITQYIDWTFFFHAWELKGRFPRIFEHPEYGKAARELYDHGEAMLRTFSAEKLVRANAVYGFWQANSDGDDIVIWDDAAKKRERLRFHMLRQQHKREAEPCLSLADFVAPIGSGVVDHIGAFAVTTGIGADELARRFERDQNDYDSIMVKALCDRLAEAFAELLHARVRREWGYGKHEQLTNRELIEEKYRGIRPAPGYPACPDHSEKTALFSLLGAEDVSITLTEHFAMSPAASVCGLYFAHPEARYFTVGRIGRDQVVDYAARKGLTVAETEKWLAPNLAYEPGASAAAAE